MNKGVIALTSVGLGAGIMYLVDPEEGKRRRARVRDAAVHASHTLVAVAGMTSRDLENRLAGLAARTQSWLVEEGAPLDDVLVARVRARLGRLVSHPGVIEVKASEGIVTLSGPIFEAEVEQAINGVQRVSGVAGIENHLESHGQAGDVSALQGLGPLKIHAMPRRTIRWTPTTRFMAGAAGLALMALASRKRTVRGAAVGLAGFELLEEAVRGARAVA